MKLGKKCNLKISDTIELALYDNNETGIILYNKIDGELFDDLCKQIWDNASFNNDSNFIYI